MVEGEALEKKEGGQRKKEVGSPKVWSHPTSFHHVTLSFGPISHLCREESKTASMVLYWDNTPELPRKRFQMTQAQGQFCCPAPVKAKGRSSKVTIRAKTAVIAGGQRS